MKVFFNNSNLVFGIQQPRTATLLRNGGLNNYANGDKVSSSFISCADLVGQKIKFYTNRPHTSRDGDAYQYYYEMIFSSDSSLIGTAPSVMPSSLPGVVKDVHDTIETTIQSVPTDSVCVAVCISEKVRVDGSWVINTLRTTTFGDYKLGFTISE